MAQTTQCELIAQLLKDGATKTSTSVKRVQVQTLQSWTRVRLEVKDKVDAYVRQEDDSYKLDKDNVVFLSVFNIVNALRDTDNDILIDHILANPKSLIVLLKDAKLSLVERKVSEGDTIDDVVADHDTIFWYCQSIEFAPVHTTEHGAITRIVDNILGI